MKNLDEALSVPAEETEILLHGFEPVPSSEFCLNARRICGSDFLMRWSLGAWCRNRLLVAVEETGGYFAVPYGPRCIVRDEDVRQFASHLDKLDHSGLADERRPDLLIFPSRDRDRVERALNRLGAPELLPFAPETHATMRLLLSRAVLAADCESSLLITGNMPGHEESLKLAKKTGGKAGRLSSAFSPTVTLKENDRSRLRRWQDQHDVPVHLWHVFFDAAFGLSLADAQRLIQSELIEPTLQLFQAPSGTTSKELIYEFCRQYVYPLVRSMETPELRANYIEDDNGHILPFVKFHGGSLSLAQEAVSILSEAASAKTTRK